MLTVKCLNNKTSIEVTPGSTLREVYDMLKLDLPYGPCSAKVNNKVVALNYRIYNNRNVEFLNIESSSGMRTYTRTLLFILCKAVEDLYPGNSIVMRSTVSRGFYLTLKLERDIESIDVRQIKKRMRELIDADITFERHECPTEEAISLFEASILLQVSQKRHRNVRIQLLFTVTIYNIIHCQNKNLSIYLIVLMC